MDYPNVPGAAAVAPAAGSTAASPAAAAAAAVTQGATRQLSLNFFQRHACSSLSVVGKKSTEGHLHLCQLPTRWSRELLSLLLYKGSQLSRTKDYCMNRGLVVDPLWMMMPYYDEMNN